MLWFILLISSSFLWFFSLCFHHFVTYSLFRQGNKMKGKRQKNNSMGALPYLCIIYLLLSCVSLWIYFSFFVLFVLFLAFLCYLVYHYGILLLWFNLRINFSCNLWFPPLSGNTLLHQLEHFIFWSLCAYLVLNSKNRTLVGNW